MSENRGRATVVLGGQWGDEGKGKIVDFLAESHDVVARFQGGANAGHTIRTEGQEYIFHLIPSGILMEGKDCLLGGGLVVDPIEFVEELEGLRARGVTAEGRIFLSSSAHMLLPYHKVLDRLEEESKKGKSIGTTGRGIGPAYKDKAARTGLRAEMFAKDDSRLERLLMERVIEINRIIDALYGGEALSPKETVDKLMALKPVIEPMLVDSHRFLHDAMRAGKNVLLEGAQGTMLDLDHGTYPYVTSSNPSIGGAIVGSGVAPKYLGDVYGVFKAYCTRVGNGPFPSELMGDEGESLRQVGAEFGATTGRPRRCGWFDLVAARYSAELNGVTQLVITKFDILCGMKKVQVCTGYRIGDEIHEDYPRDLSLLEKAEPVLREFEGWDKKLGDARNWDEIPDAAKVYLEYLSEELDAPIAYVSVGPDRKQIIPVGA
jgi:adenylosuccinate synthase